MNTQSLIKNSFILFTFLGTCLNGYAQICITGGHAPGDTIFSCENVPISTITYTTNGGVSSLGAIIGLPTGVTASLNGSNGDVTINGTPTVTGVFNFSIELVSCQDSVKGVIKVNSTPSASISYAGSPFCNSLSSPQNVTLTGSTGGSFSASPSGLTLNSATGAITPSSSNDGTYTVTYTIPASGGCAQFQTNTTVTITQAPTATISYSGSPFCSSLSSPQNVTLTGTNGGNFSATPAGLTLNVSSGAITPSSSSLGTYTVTYTIPASGGCAQFQTNTTVTITQAPTATISYSGSPFCSSLSSPQNVTLTGTNGGNFSATPAGLTLNVSSGAITPSSSSLGTYTVNYTIPASGGCAQFQTNTTVTITQAPTASISYSGSPFCNSLSSPQNVTLTGTAGGNFSASPAGLTLNVSSGAITPSSSSLGTYTVNYTIPASGGCAQFQTNTTVTITQAPTASISYSGSPFCNSLSSPQNVTLTGTGGSFSASPSGLTLNPATGAITPSSSNAGTYNVTYTIPASGGCAQFQTNTTATITQAPTASISYSGSPFCNSLSSPQNVTLTGTGGSFSASPSGLTLNPATGAITPSSSNAGTYTVTYTIPASGGCAQFLTNTTVTITQMPAATINYSGSPFCNSITSLQNVTHSGTPGGTYSANPPSGLILNAGSGAITPSSSSPGTYVITYSIPANGGCPLFQTKDTIVIAPNPVITANPMLQSVCSGLSTTPISFNSSVSGSSLSWTNNNTSIGLNNSGNSSIPSFVATNNSSVPVTATITAQSTSPIGCISNTISLQIIVNPTPERPSITNLAEMGTIPSTVCGGIENLNFNIQNSSTGVIHWSVTTTPSLSNVVDIKKDSVLNTVISFYHANINYTANVTAQFISATGCLSDTTFSININAQNDTIKEGIIIKKQPGNLLVYLDNTADGYQWGYDTLPTFRPNILNGQVYQAFAPVSKFIVSGDSLDEVNYAYWVRVRYGNCFTKIYYNGPFAPQLKTTEETIIPDNIVSIISPNPSKGDFELLLSGAIYGDIEMKIVNTLGQIISHRKEVKNEPSIRYNFNLPELKQGLYAMYITATGGDKRIVKFIVY